MANHGRYGGLVDIFDAVAANADSRTAHPVFYIQDGAKKIEDAGCILGQIIRDIKEAEIMRAIRRTGFLQFFKNCFGCIAPIRA